MTTTPPFAVHIADGILSGPWQAGGFVAMGLLLPFSLWQITDRDIPRVGVLTAAFFTASQIHIPFGPFSVHLLLNGLVGVVLRDRAPLALAVGLTLQALLFLHGGWLALGVNFGVLTVPAVAAGWVYPPLGRRVSPFVAGVIVGGAAAAGTVLLNATALYLGAMVEADEPRRWIAGASLVAHLPVIAAEGLLVGSACRVLAKARPEWLCIAPAPPAPLPPGSEGGDQAGKISSNGISH
jgi:cobalt/nickel transport system permease protein